MSFTQNVLVQSILPSIEVSSDAGPLVAVEGHVQNLFREDFAVYGKDALYVSHIREPPKCIWGYLVL